VNIVYLHTHDLGRYCEPYGYPIATPHIQRLAEEGILFRNAFCAAPTCSPSRAALLTGQYPHQNGMFGLTGQGWRLNDYSKHLAGFLGRKGYITALSGSQHEDAYPFKNLPYDELLNVEHPDGFPGRWQTTDKAIEFIKRKHSKPFFLSVGYDQNHRHHWESTFERTKELLGKTDDRYVRPLPHLPDHPAIRKEMVFFMKAVQYVDLQVGRVVQALREAGLTENTLLFFTTDHGIGLPYAKMNLTDAGTGVALIISGPGGFAGGKVIDSMVTHMDVYPTLCDLIGADQPDWLEGQTLLPLIRGEKSLLHQEIFLQQTYHGKYAPLRAVRTDRFKYVKRFGGSQSRAYFNADKGKTFDFLLSQGYDEIEVPEEQLFDLYFDTNETCNLIRDSRFLGVAEELKQKLNRWQIEMKDPLLNGDIGLPQSTLR
jgi:arylsulfatase A-like enzyme